MSESSSHSKVSRRTALAGIGTAGFVLSQGASHGRAANLLSQNGAGQRDLEVSRYQTNDIPITTNVSWGKAVFRDCHLQPAVDDEPQRLYDVSSTLGTRLKNCTVHAPIVGGSAKPEWADRYMFREFNKSVRYYHSNTALSNDILSDLKQRGIVLLKRFIAMLTSHHGLEPSEENA